MGPKNLNKNRWLQGFLFWEIFLGIGASSVPKKERADRPKTGFSVWDVSYFAACRILRRASFCGVPHFGRCLILEVASL
tara:strand:- start:1053 stop:1289 length:237 start_codon:yes stop_codon:yes gene_type:complete